jgi:hypothetical protein
MGDADAEKFLTVLGVENARGVLDILNKANCLAWGIVFGVAASTTGARAIASSHAGAASTSGLMSNHASGRPAGNMTVQNILAVLGVLSIGGAGVCKVMKIKLQDFLDKNETYAGAMTSLTPEDRKEILKCARVLMSMSKQIEEAMKSEGQKNSRAPRHLTT